MIEGQDFKDLAYETPVYYTQNYNSKHNVKVQLINNKCYKKHGLLVLHALSKQKS